ncbi:unnamed protein product [Prorocentrum cordatum]|uniref:Basic proline-rich protein-like n=1 Tax=Prorocentrum cordatum TaxID=2364126 RepID=A0ABN9VJT6_9DINO|nr:unnamed protein product [Polarella glacialis]
MRTDAPGPEGASPPPVAGSRARPELHVIDVRIPGWESNFWQLAGGRSEMDPEPDFPSLRRWKDPAHAPRGRDRLLAAPRPLKPQESRVQLRAAPSGDDARQTPRARRERAPDAAAPPGGPAPPLHGWSARGAALPPWRERRRTGGAGRSALSAGESGSQAAPGEEPEAPWPEAGGQAEPVEAATRAALALATPQTARLELMSPRERMGYGEPQGPSPTPRSPAGQRSPPTPRSGKQPSQQAHQPPEAPSTPPATSSSVGPPLPPPPAGAPAALEDSRPHWAAVPVRLSGACPEVLVGPAPEAPASPQGLPVRPGGAGPEVPPRPAPKGAACSRGPVGWSVPPCADDEAASWLPGPGLPARPACEARCPLRSPWSIARPARPAAEEGQGADGDDAAVLLDVRGQRPAGCPPDSALPALLASGPHGERRRCRGEKCGMAPRAWGDAAGAAPLRLGAAAEAEPVPAEGPPPPMPRGQRLPPPSGARLARSAEGQAAAAKVQGLLRFEAPPQPRMPPAPELR